MYLLFALQITSSLTRCPIRSVGNLSLFVLRFCSYKVFAWDENKDRTNRKKHGISFETAARVFEDPNVLSYPDRIIGDEERWHSIGLVGGVAIILVVHTSEEQNGEEKIRIVSARNANPRERALYDSPHA